MATDKEPYRTGSGGLDVIGQVLEGRYRVNSLLGRGGFGSVYLATDERSFGRSVVIKVPHPEFLADPGFRKRFEKEIQSLVHLEHQRITKVLDTGAIGSVPYAVLQFLPGGSLADRLGQTRTQGSAEIRRWLPSVAEALDFIHRKGFLHRDVKPANILFDGEGHVYLSDFGIAKALEQRDTALTQEGRVPGSPVYMGPEAIKRMPLGPGYDQYALGVVVYQCLCGASPHEGDSPIAILVQRATQPAKPLDEQIQGLPPPVVAAVMRTLEADPSRRFATCSEFAEAFIEGYRWRVDAMDTPTAELDTGAGTATLVGSSAATAPSVPATPVLTPVNVESESERRLATADRIQPPGGGRGRLIWVAALLGLAAAVGGGWLYLNRRQPMEVSLGRILVSSVPPRARVVAVDQDGRRTEGQTPAALTVEVGDYSIEVTRAGYGEFRKTVRVLAGADMAVEAVLEPSGVSTDQVVRVSPAAEPDVPSVVGDRATPESRPTTQPTATWPPVLPATPPPAIVEASPVAPAESKPTPGEAPASAVTPGASPGAANVVEVSPTVVPSPVVAPPTVAAPAATPIPAGEAGQIDVLVLPGNEEIEMVWVPGGTFSMGCAADEGCDESEMPRHTVRVDGMWMSRFELTQRQWKSVQGTSPSAFKGDARPVENVSWEDVQGFLQHAGAGLRLPTEAEWEYAARGGSDSAHYPWGTAEPDGTQANYCDRQCNVAGHDDAHDDGFARTATGGNYGPNGFGLYDMAGNVSEWCQDGFRPDVYRRRTGVTQNPQVAEGLSGGGSGSGGMLRVLRGGNWGSRPAELTCAHRGSAMAGSRLNTTGFRVVRSAGR